MEAKVLTSFIVAHALPVTGGALLVLVLGAAWFTCFKD